MIGHMFTSMNELLDGIRKQYPGATEQERIKFRQQLSELKRISDDFIEQWLQFEEKMADFKETCGGQVMTAPDMTPEAVSEAVGNIPSPSAKAVCSEADLVIPEEAAVVMDKGQGYYKLFMFAEAARLFQSVVSIAPESNLARLFLGMSQMHLRNWNEAQRQFQLLVVLSDFPKWLALGYNALGCIQAVRMNMAHAEKLFTKAYEVYPEFSDSLNNLKSCRQSPSGQLSLYFGSTELICL